MDTFPAHRALRAELHLACIRGPDLGCVVPVEAGLRLGRGRDGVTDPYSPRDFAVIAATHDRKGRQQIYLKPRYGKHRPLRAGLRVKTGANTWEVRTRPTRFTWPGSVGKSQASNRMRVFRWMMPLFVLAFLVRLLPRQYWMILGVVLVVSALVGVVVWARAGKRWDEAALLLTVASREPPAIADAQAAAESQEVATVLARPTKRGKLKLEAGGGSVAVVGGDGLGLQQWLRGQAWAVGADLEVGLFEALGQTPTSTSLVVPARPVGSASWSKQMERALSPRDALESLVHFSDVVGRPAPASIHNEWARATKRSELVATVGKGSSGNVHLDFGKEGPHALVVGGTGSGKSEFLSTMVLSLAATHSPDDLRFVFIDFKGGAGLDHLADLPHVEHSISDLDGTRVAWLLRALDKALQRRKRTMAVLGARSWSEARTLSRSSGSGGVGAPEVGPRLMVVVDEFQILSEAHPDLMDRLAKLAAQGRSLGFHLVLASQRPGGAITPALRSTLDLRVALRCTEKRDSVEVIGIGDAAELPRIPGRAIIGSQQVQLAMETSVDSWVSVIGEVWEENFGQTTVGEGADKKAVIPAVLPDSVSHEGGALGTFESPVDSTLQTLVDHGGSVGIFGPRSHEGELAQMAAVFTTGLRTIWIGDAPPSMVGSQEICDMRSRTDVRIIPPEDLGAVARALVQISRGQAGAEMVVIPEASRLLSRLESLVGVEQCTALWEGLVRAGGRDAGPAASPSPTFATAPAPVSAPAPAPVSLPWRLVVTDSKPRGDLTGLDVSLLRIPTRQTLLWGPLSNVLPVQMPGAPEVPVTRPVDLEEFVSPLWGRVLVSGVVEGQTVWSQIGLPPPPPTPLPPSVLGHSTLTALPQPEGSSPHEPTTPLFPSDTTVMKPAVVDLALESQLAKMEERGLIRSVLPAEGWPRVATTAGPLLVMEPPKEVLRVLASRFPADALWLQASFPLPNGSAILTGQDGAHYLDAQQVMSLLAPGLGDTVQGAA